MISYKAFMKYTPPDFRIFKEYGHGLLWFAERMCRFTRSAHAYSQTHSVTEPDWGVKPTGFPEEDFVAVYAYWTMADEMLKRLDRMDVSERKKHLDLDTNTALNCTLEKVTELHADLDGQIVAWEKKEWNGRMGEMTNRQLKRRLDTWECLLEDAKETDFMDADEFADVSDYCEERTLLEYAAIGIGLIKLREPERLDPLPYFDTFCERRMASDGLFRSLLRGRYDYVPWAEPKDVFWWHHPSQKM